jgi:uncharacterized protein
MRQIAHFTFFGNLNDFLSKRNKNTSITYSFNGTPTVKDAVEAIGVPHVEVEWMLLNGQPAQFHTSLHAEDRVDVFPQDTLPPLPHPSAVRNRQALPHTFALDTHLGALARLLRLMGLDTHYQWNITDRELAQRAATDHCIVLTRDISLLKQKIIEWGYWLRSQDPYEQLLEVVRRYNLSPYFEPFTRCLLCNAFIHPVEKALVLHQLPPNTEAYFDEFYQCKGCGKVYWKGSHYERMQELISRVIRDVAGT